MIYLTVKNVELDIEALKKHIAEAMGLQEYEIDFVGNYALLREFGIPASGKVDKKFVAQVTKQLMDKGMDHDAAMHEAIVLAESISKNGMKPSPFFRPAQNAVMSEWAGKDIKISDLKKVVNEIAQRAEANFKVDSKNMSIEIPLTFTIKKKRKEKP